MEAPVYRIAKRIKRKGYEYFIDRWGSRCWYLDGSFHNEDGPAIEYADGTKHWSLNGIEVSEHDFNEVWECPSDKLPLYINTVFLPIVKRRLNGSTRL